MKNDCQLIFLMLALSLPSLGQIQAYKGYPSKIYEENLQQHFLSPPPGYGNVPFYWWNGDSLRKERLEEQLDILSSSAIDGFAVSYIHTTPRVDTLENKNGYGLYGMTEPGVPRVFSDEWWKIWNWFSGEAGKRGLGVGLDDYTMGWHGNGFYPDELDTMKVFKGYSGELVIKIDSVQGGKTIELSLPDNLLTVVSWPGKILLTDNIVNGKIGWTAPGSTMSYIYTISTLPGYVIHPEHGQKLIDVYFNRFEQKLDDKGRTGMNYFFQDELSYPIKVLSWSDDFRKEFIGRKGYDILPYLPALKYNIGPETPRIRMDYCEVLMDLSEERYYKPIFNWHADRGLIYGCDNLSRGKNPAAYIDYFRAMSWFTAPGNDAPARGSSFIETKISSSIAHLYNRPRTWLEAFHSMGWGSSGAWLTDQIDHHFIAGGNLVCMHGLYYSTHGGWWEWAPPDFHFRMPYWPHMKQWLNYTQRMSFILSQGSHVCDIAVIYPTESIQAYRDAKPDKVFAQALMLSNRGFDYDFVDFRTLRQAKIVDRKLQMAAEQYKILIIADMEAIHHSSLALALEFFRAGGIVLATGHLPRATSLSGEDDDEMKMMLYELFGLTSAEVEKGVSGQKKNSAAGGVGWYISDSLEHYIGDLITPDFKPDKNGGKVLHREIGDKDIYLVKDVEKDSECFFRSKGKVEIWDAHTGLSTSYPILKQDSSGTYLKMKKEKGNSYLLVFSPGEPLFEENEQINTGILSRKLPIDGDWTVELKPTLNNKWGDYRFPAFDGFIGAEARSFRYTSEKYKLATKNGNAWSKPDFDDKDWEEEIYGYGPQLMTRVDDTDWTQVSFSWQYGVWDNPGGQGYHGLKGKVDDRFFILDKGANQMFRTWLHVENEGVYRLVTEGVPPLSVTVDDKKIDKTILLTKGWHEMEAHYNQSEKYDYKSRTGLFTDPRRRGIVLFYPENSSLPEKNSVYASKVSSRWDKSGHLLYDPYGGTRSEWYFRFESVPGLEDLSFALNGELIDIWVAGEKIKQQRITRTADDNGINHYWVKPPVKQPRKTTVAFSVKAMKGYQGTAIIREPVYMKTSAGLMNSGDWSKEGALRYYSGGIRYHKSCQIDNADNVKQVLLRLGEVVASCEVSVNGQLAGIMLSPPYDIDITHLIQEGENTFDILVYSTLSNHYQTIPTPYRGDPVAGLIGPVSLEIYK